ncbi:DUF7344 domain-containing protein [Halorubrum vacuolatum]|uniref:Winged helix-turn-helix DNA-binding n=1 Tax=Halorubrum vacuolatum TaxID=63740 RepID=A0A238Y9X3_HALVU|nr:winged helix-turn-helix transcriptional regulator [Halorubrum vacuolatum]SNR67947.1 Winged helix-turn-helix DNA-binding [Halorubrum vacuolatum]
MTTPEDTRPGRDNSTARAPIDVELINHLMEAGESVSIEYLADQLGVTRDRVKRRVRKLEEKGLIIVSIGLYHASVSLAGGVYPVSDGGDTPELDDAVIYTALSNGRRRAVIRTLAEEARQAGGDETYVAVSALADVVHASEEGTPPSGRHATYVSLTQTHLPLLDDLGVVEYYERVQKVHPVLAITLDEVLDTVSGITGGDDVGR